MDHRECNIMEEYPNYTCTDIAFSTICPYTLRRQGVKIITDISNHFPKRTCSRDRERFIWLWSQGLSLRFIGRLGGWSHSTVRRWVRRFTINISKWRLVVQLHQLFWSNHFIHCNGIRRLYENPVCKPVIDRKKYKKNLLRI